MNIVAMSESNANFTCLQGYVKTTYDELVTVFGSPKYGPNDGGDKVTCEWAVNIFYLDENEDEQMETVTIYDWNQYNTPFNEYRWHIGGFDSNAVAVVTAAMNKEAVYA
jgi:hypothetical protein